ncbi:hypothetical protein CIB84_006098 [Bambusicola thoracicus]|uniref:Uncharacterized protein n=1 Tax=Bambusicola thoracicus TaxID=9083 RepID=A0A2P4T1B3_BAMTH|nr:hypothetical protein CIB84_006098 [Bambusicola thoracicus]
MRSPAPTSRPGGKGHFPLRVMRGVENAVTGHNSKAKVQVTGKRAVLEEIGNKVARGSNVPKKADCIKPPVKATKGPGKMTNTVVPPKPPAAVNRAVKDTTTASKVLSPVPMDVSMQEEDLCQAFSDVLLHNIEDIDADDSGNPQLCSDYVKDIYLYLRQLELQQSVRPYYLDGKTINGRMRAILVDWLVQVHSRFQLLQETLYMCVAVMDRFLQADAEQHTLAKYLMELTLIDYDMVHYHPSEIAAAALCLSQKVLGHDKWGTKQQYYTGYAEDSLAMTMKHMAKNVVKVNENLTKYTAVRNKYASSKLLRISTISQLNSKTIKDLAASLL